MSDTRRSQYPKDRNDVYNDRHVGYEDKQGLYGDKGSGRDGRADRKIAMHTSRYGARYAPYHTKQHQSWRAKERTEPRDNVRRLESYARDVHPASNERSSNVNKSEVRIPEGFGSAGKKIASKIVTPMRGDQDANVTQRHREIIRPISFSPKEKEMIDEDQMIGALTCMEVIGTSNNDDDMHDDEMIMVEHEDDFLGEDLMELEEQGLNSAVMSCIFSLF